MLRSKVSFYWRLFDHFEKNLGGRVWRDRLIFFALLVGCWIIYSNKQLPRISICGVRSSHISARPLKMLLEVFIPTGESSLPVKDRLSISIEGNFTSRNLPPIRAAYMLQQSLTVTRNSHYFHFYMIPLRILSPFNAADPLACCSPHNCLAGYFALLSSVNLARSSLSDRLWIGDRRRNILSNALPP